MALNMIDDYFDFIKGTDIFKSGEKNEYAGGSGVLVSGELKPITMYRASLFLYSITFAIGIYLTIKIGLVILLLGLFGGLSSYFYTAPPVKFSYHGFGELAMLINLGPVIIIGSYYTSTQTIPFEVIYLSLPLGIFMFTQILANELPDQATDALAGKNTLIVRLGKKGGVYLIIFSTILGYLIILTNALVDYAPMITILALATLPIAIKGIMKLSRSLNSKAIEGNLEMMKVHDYTGILLIFVYCFAATIDNQNEFATWVIMLTTLLLYCPVILKFYSK